MIFLSFFAMFSIYEIGYIINDAITIRIEKDPVLRLTQNELDYFERKGLFIFGVRFSFLLLFCISLFLLTNDTMTCFLLCNIALLTTYFFHNYYRNNIRFITNTILNIGKYFIPLISIDFVFPLLSSIAYFIFFPFFRSLTYVLEKKTTANVNVFQIIFVLLFLAFLILLYSFIKLSFYEYSFYGLFSAYKIAVCLLQMKRK